MRLEQKPSVVIQGFCGAPPPLQPQIPQGGLVVSPPPGLGLSNPAESSLLHSPISPQDSTFNPVLPAEGDAACAALPCSGLRTGRGRPGHPVGLSSLTDPQAPPSPRALVSLHSRHPVRPHRPIGLTISPVTGQDPGDHQRGSRPSRNRAPLLGQSCSPPARTSLSAPWAVLLPALGDLAPSEGTGHRSCQASAQAALQLVPQVPVAPRVGEDAPPPPGAVRAFPGRAALPPRPPYPGPNGPGGAAVERLPALC
ncbi:wiskott-Aldrich syndrome protein homolog 1 [Nannospalax galili]|uniref:wiskott-Aldrich syndrome protein homolog 1 n=1 Tax=Nannospalax galili TaxID=1026970 RepID=UPI0004ECFDE7|nr:wiskott-Aldrich syndrome protein homolog 1 [Nannospalax galili]